MLDILVYVLIGAAGMVAASYFFVACLEIPHLFWVVLGFGALILFYH